MLLRFELISEATPGAKWERCFSSVWPAYRDWFLGEGVDARTGLSASRALLSRHMPELVETFEQVCDLAGGDDLASCFLSMVDPPKYAAGCSQLAWIGAEPALIRNYDFSPSLLEGVVWRTEWVRPVIGVSECTWGLLDGMNADGLAVCLAFGGRRVVGKGFGVPLVVRYLLETCGTVAEACETVSTLPVHMTFSLTMVDASGHCATVHLSPDRDAVITNEATCTNHQLGVEWPEYAIASRTEERKACLDALHTNPSQDRTALIQQFLRSPLYNDNYEGTGGTLYTAVYDTLAGSLDLVWPSQDLSVCFDDFEERIINIEL
jgi:predicted choloylglycine hydrolase